MTYSCAVFATPDQSLADAQRNKYRIIAERAGLAPGMHVLEIGTGWGGFALYAAGELGCRVTTITISEAQHELGRERVGEAGLADRVEVELRDYREVARHVRRHRLDRDARGRRRRVLRDLLRGDRPGARARGAGEHPDDRASRTSAYEPQRRGANWIQAYIFPGGLLPSLAAIERALHGTRLLVPGRQDIAPTTSGRWRRGAPVPGAAATRCRRSGFDERFIRMWEYYLALSEAGFATGLVQDQQIVLEKRAGWPPDQRPCRRRPAPTGLWLDPRRSWPGMPKG